MITYHFKVSPEAVRFIIIACLGPIIAALGTLDPNKLDNLKVWSISLGIAVFQALFSAILTLLTTKEFTKN